MGEVSTLVKSIGMYLPNISAGNKKGGERMDLKEMVKDHFTNLEEIKTLQRETKDLDERIVKEIVETKQLDFLSVNWKRLHRFSFGHPGRKG
jgi:hypothetical protein